MTTHEVLVKARNLIDSGGLTKGYYGKPSGERCAQGGILDALSCLDNMGCAVPIADAVKPMLREANLVLAAQLGDFPFEREMRPGMRHRLGDEWADAIERIITFNNAPGRTKEQVLAVFDAAVSATAPPPLDLDLSELVEASEQLA